MRTLNHLLAALALAVSPALCARAQAPRDWSAHPAVLTIDAPPTIYDVADIHGDYDKAVALFAGAHLIKAVPERPELASWAAADSILVCTGDMIDKGPKSVEVLRLLRALQVSAKAAGGQVIVTLGNHEAEFIAGAGANAKGVDFQDELKSLHVNPASVAAGTDSDGLGGWLRDRPIAARVGQWFFSHAGNTGGSTVAELETAIEAGVDRDGFGAAVLVEPNSILEARTAPVPWWITHESTPDPYPATPGLRRLKDNARALDCQHLVIGHAPNELHFAKGMDRKKGEPFCYAGVLFLMDTGMSRGVDDGKAQLLKITTAAPVIVKTVDSKGKEKRLWSEPAPTATSAPDSTH